MMLLGSAPPRYPSSDRDAIGIDHRHHHGLPPQRKRKADSPPENNERLSKRLSLLNLEQNGSKLYVPVETPRPSAASSPQLVPLSPASPRPSRPPVDNDSMQLDDTKHKVYIYNLEDELSDGESDDGKLLFLPDISDHLRSHRIPRHVLSPPASDSAGRELVLYNVPTSLSVPEEQDGVRKAVIEARDRIREKQRAEREDAARGLPATGGAPSGPLSAGVFAADQPGVPRPSPAPHDPDEMEID